MDKIQRKILIIYGSILLAGCLYTAFIFWNGHGFPCYFRELTGLYCPGCGSSRMMLAVMRLDFLAAIRYNPVAFLAFPSWIVISLLAFIGHPACFRRSKVLFGIFYVTIGLYCIQCILRNILLF